MVNCYVYKPCMSVTLRQGGGILKEEGGGEACNGGGGLFAPQKERQ